MLIGESRDRVVLTAPIVDGFTSHGFDQSATAVMPLAVMKPDTRSMLLTFSSIVDTANINESNTREKALSKTRSPNA